MLSLTAHTPDNSFLGFVVGSNVKNRTALVKKNTALVYGKELYMWEASHQMREGGEGREGREGRGGREGGGEGGREGGKRDQKGGEGREGKCD